jgi:hypothetical protein
MNYLIAFLMLGLIGCATKKDHGGIGNLDQDDEMLGAELPDWIDSEGPRNGYIYAVGEAEYSAEKLPSIVKEAAQHNAKMRITERMPTNYKVIAQRSLSDASNGEFNKIEITKGDLHGLDGVTVSRKYSTCRKMIRHTKDDKVMNRICYVRAMVPVKNFNRAIVRTIKKLHGDDVSNKFSKILEKNMQKELE